MKFGRYIDPFSISIDIRRSQRSDHGSFIAIDSIRLHNCEPGKYIYRYLLSSWVITIEINFLMTVFSENTSKDYYNSYIDDV